MFKKSLCVVFLAFLFLFHSSSASSTFAAEPKVELTPEILAESSALSQKNPVGPNNPRAEYTLSNGWKVVKTYKETPVPSSKFNKIIPYADTVSGQTRVEYSEDYWVGGANAATLKGKWLITVYRDNSGVRIDKWDYFLVTIRGEGTYSNKSTEIYKESGTMRSPAVARGYVTFTTALVQGDAIWEVSIKPDRSITASTIDG